MQSAQELALLAPLPYLPCTLHGTLLTRGKGYLISGRASRLDAFSAYPVRARLPCHGSDTQQVHRRPVQPGPLVLGPDPLRYPPPAPDRDRTVSRRSEPSSRTALMGEQPNPWEACYPQGSFCPLSDGNPTSCHRITKSRFRACPGRRRRSQPAFCLCTLLRWFPSIPRRALSASDTLSEATAPVKLPAWQRPRTGCTVLG